MPISSKVGNVVRLSLLELDVFHMCKVLCVKYNISGCNLCDVFVGLRCHLHNLRIAKKFYFVPSDHHRLAVIRN